MTIAKRFIPEAISMYGSGKTAAQIAAILGLDKDNVSRSLRNAGVKMRKNSDYLTIITKNAITEARSKYEAGASTRELATEYGVCPGHMCSLLAASGPMRPDRYGVYGEHHDPRSYSYVDRKMRSVVRKAIADGTLTPEPCNTCGRQGKAKDGRSIVVAHHCDYNKPLEVVWLCCKCHTKWHMTHEAIPLNKDKAHGIEVAP